MNKNKYKLIFSKSKSCLIPVAENVQSAINNSSSDTDTSSQERSVFNFKLNAISTFIQSTLLPIFAVSLLSTHSFANSVEVDGIKTKITTVGNDILLIDIAKPEFDGISDNRFKEFNVTNGAVFNNSTNDGNSHLVGYVKGNASLEGEAAKVILNQVTGHNSTQLTGGLEVLGQKADLLIINPNGININGVQTRNTERFVISTSNVIAPQKGLNLDVDKGTITIEENGLATDGLKYLDIVAKKITQKGAIKNHNDDSSSETNINLIAGSTSYDVVQQKITSKGEIVDEVIISGEELGAMHGKHIQFVTTDSGAGIKHSNIILSESDIKFTTNNGNVDLQTVHSKDKVEVDGTNQINLNKGITSQSIVLNAQSINVKNKAKIKAQRVEFNAKENINLESDSIITAIDIHSQSKQLNVENNATFFAINSVITSSEINNSGELSANELLTIITKGSDKSKQTNGYKNSGLISSKGDLKLIFTDNTNFNSNIHSLPEAHNKLMLTTNLFYIEDNARLRSNANVHIHSKIFKNKGLLTSAKELNIMADYIKNNGLIAAKEGMSLISKNTDNYDNSVIYTDGKLNLDSNETVYNLGEIFAKDKITISAVKFINDVELSGGIDTPTTFKQHTHQKYYDVEFDDYSIELNVPEFINNLRIKNAGFIEGESGLTFIQKETRNTNAGIFNYSVINIKGEFENNNTINFVNNSKGRSFDLINDYLKKKVDIKISYMPKLQSLNTGLSVRTTLKKESLYELFDNIFQNEYAISSAFYYGRTKEIMTTFQGVNVPDFQRVMLLVFGQNWTDQDYQKLQQSWGDFKKNKPSIIFHPSNYKAKLFADRLTGMTDTLANSEQSESNSYQKHINAKEQIINSTSGVEFKSLHNGLMLGNDVEFLNLKLSLGKINLLIDRSFQQVDPTDTDDLLSEYTPDINNIKTIIDHSSHTTTASESLSSDAEIEVRDIDIKTHNTYNSGTIVAEKINIEAEDKIQSSGDIISTQETHLTGEKGIEVENKVIFNGDGSSSVHQAHIESQGNIKLETDANSEIDLTASEVKGHSVSIKTQDLNLKDDATTNSSLKEEDIYSRISGKVIGQSSQQDFSVTSVGSTLEADNLDLNLTKDLNQKGSSITTDSIVGVVQGNYNTEAGINTKHSESSENVAQLEFSITASGNGHQAGLNINEKEGINTGITDNDRFGLHSDLAIKFTKIQEEHTALTHTNSRLSVKEGRLNVQGIADIGGVNIDATSPLTEEKGFELSADRIQSTKQQDQIDEYLSTTSIKLGIDAELHSSIGDTVNSTLRQINDLNKGLKQDGTVSLQATSDVLHLITGDAIGGSIKNKGEITQTEHSSHQNADIATHIEGKVVLSSHSDITLKNVGSSDKSQLSLKAVGDVNLVAGETDRTESTTSFSATITSGNYARCGIMSDGCEVGVSASFDGSSSDSHQNSKKFHNTELKATHLSIDTGGNLNLAGANIDSKSLELEVKGSTNIESVQDELNSKTTSQSANLGIGASITTALRVKPSLSVGFDIGTESEHRKEVNKQSGITSEHLTGHLEEVNLSAGHLINKGDATLLQVEGKVTGKELTDSHHKDGGTFGGSIGTDGSSLSQLDIRGGRSEQKHYEATQHSAVSGVTNIKEVEGEVKTSLSEIKTISQDDTVARTSFNFEILDLKKLSDKGKDYTSKVMQSSDTVNEESDPIYEEIGENGRILPPIATNDNPLAKRPLPPIPEDASIHNTPDQPTGYTEEIYAIIDKSPEAIAKANNVATTSEIEEEFAPLLPARPELKDAAGRRGDKTGAASERSLLQSIRKLFAGKSSEVEKSADSLPLKPNYEHLEDSLNLKGLIVLENERNQNFEKTILENDKFLDEAREAAKKIISVATIEQMKNVPEFDEILTEGAKKIEIRINEAVTFQPTIEEFSEIQRLVQAIPKGTVLDISEQTLHILDTLATTSKTIKKSPELKEQLHNVIEAFLTESKDKALTVAMVEKLNYNLRPEEGPSRILYKDKSLTKDEAIFSSVEASKLQLAQTVDFINNAKSKGVEPSVLASLVYQRLIDYHPFAEGNGRITRVITNKLLLDAGYSVFPTFDKRFEMRITPRDNESEPQATNSEVVQEFLRTLQRNHLPSEENRDLLTSSVTKSNTPVTDRVKDRTLVEQPRSSLQKLSALFQPLKVDSRISKVRSSVSQFGGDVVFKFSQSKGEVYNEIIKHIETENGVCEAVCTNWIAKKVNTQNLWDEIYDQPKNGEKGKLNKDAFENIKKLQTEFINSGSTATEQFTLTDSWLSEQGVVPKEKTFGTLSRQDKVEGGVSRDNTDTLIKTILDTGSEQSAAKKISINIKDGVHTVSATIIGEKVAFFDPNFGEMEFSSREKFNNWFKNSFWKQSGYAENDNKTKVFNVTNYHITDKE
ncbi:YopT-type cysteine protease domain-containing protein [Pasteurella atlantica]|uniref:YopT-type cysteine protease domain-containing protein n=2 Tax=Pasteurella atlantica TaxID=2827233 RepID=UPI00274D65C6|nr:YopT-type cysteine protease domain-containing protein [Pasteurella atlantica]MDP8129693.1 YopT-type cysteine protease domain-containing protein [Pasteurella atlantica]